MTVRPTSIVFSYELVNRIVSFPSAGVTALAALRLL